MWPTEEERVHRLFGRGDVVGWFTGDRGLVPWPRWKQRPLGANRDRSRHQGVPVSERAAAIRATLSGPAVLHDIDPRLLCASQPFVIRHHARYYAEADDYWFAGITSADVLSALNRFPTFEAVAGGRFVIRSGHHRSLVALLNGTPVRGRIVGDTTRGPASVTPLLAIGAAGGVSVGAAVSAVRDRRPATVPDQAAASAVLDALSATDGSWSVPRTGWVLG